MGSVAAAVDTGRRTARLVRANLRWALLYNICAVPLAALGFVPPWLAAVGMCSSIWKKLSPASVIVTSTSAAYARWSMMSAPG